MAIIKTPDQRVRVFISSTINELADERLAAREAIENLRLIPVFFEAGARPHPPRDLYSAYLEQSHIFVGIYWNSYGWVAPGAEISGLEDEYRLCGNKKPKLIYVKQSDSRQEQLQALLRDIEKSDTACYQKFNSADELKILLANDLSVLMSEIFETALFAQENPVKTNIGVVTNPVKKIELPALRSEMVGREKDLENTIALLRNNTTNLLNILGAGGTGKTTLSIHLAHAIADDFRDGVFFVPLAPVTDINLVVSTIANILELFDSGKQQMVKTLVDYLQDKNLLLVLDNFEQVVEAADVVNAILQKCPGVKIIVTSRSGLHIRGEHMYNLLPLSIPGESRMLSDDAFHTCPSVELFITRAKAVNSNLLLDAENKNAIVSICNKLDGLPLAIELAASRTKMFQPSALIKRMDKMLELTSKGHRDLPERQQTLRNAIYWSYNLLDEESQKVFCILGIFKRSWTMEAADAIVNTVLQNEVDIEDVTEKLLDVSLVKPVIVGHSNEPRFNMLQTVFEFAGEMLNRSEYYTSARVQFAEYFLDMLEQTEGILYSTASEPWLDKIEYEYQNIRAAFYFLIENKNYEDAWQLFELMVPYWIIRGGYTDVNMWIVAAGIESYNNAEIMQKVSAKQKGATQTWAALVILMLIEIERGYALLHAAEENAEEAGDMRSLAYALLLDGCYGYFMKMPDAVEKIHKAKEMVNESTEPFMQCMFLMWSYEYYRAEGMLDIMHANLEKAHSIAQKHDLKYILGSLYLINYSLTVLSEKNDFEALLENSLNMYALFPEKGYTGMKSAAMAGVAYCLFHLNRIDEVKPYLMKSLAYTRECGEKESEFYNVMEASMYYQCLGNIEKACKLFGSVDGFIEAANYPVVGATEVQYNEAKNLVYPDASDAQKNKWYLEGKRIPLGDAVVLAMKMDN